ncbi:hypothetical protein GCM10025777_15910 [Membranihabitans marinus]
MAFHSSTVVYAKALKNYEEEVNGVHYDQTEFEVISLIKGQISQRFSVRGMSRRIGEWHTLISGENKFEVDKIYVLMLEPINEALWKTKLLSYGVLEEIESESVKIMVPVLESRLISLQPNESFEPLQAYHTNGLLSMLKEVSTGVIQWDASQIVVDYDLEERIQVELRAQPSHCSYLANSRWENLDSDAIEVYSHEDGDTSISNVSNLVSSAISDMMSNYDNILLTYSGSHDYSPDTLDDSVLDGQFYSYAWSKNRGRTIIIQYNDPQDEIDDLNNCNGILAYGGMYYSARNDEFNGVTWNSSTVGYVLVNNGVGNCLSNSQYEIMLIHEMTHSLGLDHIPATKRANMNPSCCNSITNNDIECVNFAYENQSLPLDLLAFYASIIDEEGVELIWETVNEVNHDYFEIQYSTDGYQFDVLDKMVNQHPEIDSKEYNYLHSNPKLGLNYYRLKQYDFDGSYTYSPTRSIQWSGGKQNELSLYPNPTSAEIVIQNLGLKPAHYSLSDVTGRLITQGALQSNSLNFDFLNAGTYILTIEQDNNLFVERLIIL